MEKVAIIIPVFYREHLEKAIKSILVNKCDIIIVNDSDLPLVYNHERVSIIDNDGNLGVGISRNRGVKAALNRGYDFIGFVDSDSIISRNWLSHCLETLSDSQVIGVSGLALNPNQKSWIARVKFVLKDYARRNQIPFQIDCSLFRRDVFSYAGFGSRRIGEDSYFLERIDILKLRVNENAISYHHEVDSVFLFFKKEIIGALYSMSNSLNVAKSFLLTPYTSLKMLFRWRRHRDYPIAALIWILRQIAWNLAYAIGRIAGIGGY